MKKKKVVSQEVERTKQLRKQMTFGERVEDAWYQYKWFILLGIFCIIVAVTCVYQYITRETYDYSLIFITDEQYGYKYTDYLFESVVSFGEDIDGNGKINADATVMSYADLDDNPTTYSANSVLVDNHISQCDVYVFIMDEYSYEQYKNTKGLFTNDGSTLSIDEAGVKLSETNLKFYAQSAGFEDDLYIFLRYFDDSHAEEAQKSVELYNSIVNVE